MLSIRVHAPGKCSIVGLAVIVAVADRDDLATRGAAASDVDPSRLRDGRFTTLRPVHSRMRQALSDALCKIRVVVLRQARLYGFCIIRVVVVVNL